MLQKFLISFFLIFLVSACATTPKDEADSSGSGSSAGELESVDYTSDSVASGSDDYSIVPGSQEDLIVNVGDRVYFSFDSYELDDDAKELLQDQAAWLKQYNKSSIIIEGHCDERGTREYNLALGEKRAQTVKNYLNGLGVGSMSTISYGKERPAVVGSNEGAWSQNRRSVTIVN